MLLLRIGGKTIVKTVNAVFGVVIFPYSAAITMLKIMGNFMVQMVIVAVKFLGIPMRCQSE